MKVNKILMIVKIVGRYLISNEAKYRISFVVHRGYSVLHIAFELFEIYKVALNYALRNQHIQLLQDLGRYRNIAVVAVLRNISSNILLNDYRRLVVEKEKETKEEKELASIFSTSSATGARGFCKEGE
jgi:hypothetical protein